MAKEAESINTVVTDSYGDFKFDNLEENSGPYRITIQFEGQIKWLDVELEKSVYLGDIAL